MKISIITPIYEGNSFLNSYLKNIEQASELFINVNEHNSVEVIFVNDSPWIEPEYDKTIVSAFELELISNERNCGIHKSRINGLKAATGDYVIFLDQDDVLTEKSLVALSNAANGAEIVLGNGLFEKKETEELIFGNKFSQDFAAKPFVYRWIRDFIVSPGQCLVKRESIPEYWVEHPLNNNGTDDYFLWLLMLDRGAKISCCYHTVYIHKYTGGNLSLDEDYMFTSTREMLSILRKDSDFSENHLKLIKRRIYYKKVDRSKKILFFKESLKNLDVLAVNIGYRLVWRGCLIKPPKAGHKGQVSRK